MCSLKWTFRSSSSTAFAKIQTTTKLVVWYHSYLPQPNRCLTIKNKNSPKRNFLLLHCPLQVIPCLMEHGLLLGKPKNNYYNVMQLNWAHNNHMQVHHIKVTEQRALFYTTFGFYKSPYYRCLLEFGWWSIWWCRGHHVNHLGVWIGICKLQILLDNLQLHLNNHSCVHLTLARINNS